MRSFSPSLAWYLTAKSHIPLLHVFRHISLSRDDKYVLISYEGKDPSQLWRMTETRDGNKSQRTVQLSLVNTYLTNPGEEFTIPSCFGGMHDELIICARKCENYFSPERV